MDANGLHKQILELVRAYHGQRWSEQGFVPGQTRIPYAARVFDAEELVNLVDASLDFWLTAGPYTRKFEAGLTELLGVPHASFCNSGSSANLLAISALTSPKLAAKQLHQGDEVITVAAGFPTTIAPIVQNGLVPVFVDVELATANVDVEMLADAVSDRTRAVFLAHTLGNPFDVGAVRAIVEQHDLWFVEDSCDALGSMWGGQCTSTFGHLGTFSFYPAHHITTGEGGAVVTADQSLLRIVNSFRDWGRDCWCPPGCQNSCGRRFGWQMGSLPYGYDHKFIYSHLGYNLKPTDMQAAIGVAQLTKLPAFMEARQHNFTVLRTELAQHEKFFILPEATPNSEPNWFGFLLVLREGCPFTRRELIEYLETSGIATRTLFAGNMLRQPAFEGVQHRVSGRLSNTEKLMEDAFWIGVYPGLTEAMLEYVVAKIGSFIAKF